jgi:hypothetical protein
MLNYTFRGHFVTQRSLIGFMLPGIAFIGDFSDTAPNQASFDAVRAFLSCSKRLSPNPAIDVAEDTPIYDVIKTWASPAKE